MFAIEIELLAGRYAASEHNDRTRAEWPPHPARFFSALVAAHYENQPPDPDEREALEWLEREPPPSLDVSLRAGHRAVLDVFVPVNDVTTTGDPDAPARRARARVDDLRARGDGDKAVARELKAAQKDLKKAEERFGSVLADYATPDPKPANKQLQLARALLPGGRTRQVRWFPVAFPERMTFAFGWPHDPPPGARAALARLCARVTRLGHSSSMVRCVLTDAPIQPTLVPDERGSYTLRTVSAGQLRRLDEAFARHQGVDSRVLPARPCRYGPPEVTTATWNDRRSVFSDEWILFERVGGARPVMSRGADLALALRRALLEQAGATSLPPSISGHATGGAPTREPHVAFASLPYVGSEHADGSIQGWAIILPREMPQDARRKVLRLIANWENARAIDARSTLELAVHATDATLLRRVDISTKASLSPNRWCQSSTRFVTATPIALDRYPGNLRSNSLGTATKAAQEASTSIADACERIGLARPCSVDVSFAPLLRGALPARAFLPAARREGRAPRVRVHAQIVFEEAVRGPVLLGAGRFLGLGLCLPIPQERR